MNRHFAALGDVWKHLPLAEILRIRPSRHYWETHAGSESYPLSESPMRLHGALRFLSLAPQDSQLAGCNYLRILHARPGIYPGSSALVMHTLGENANYIFCDIDPESAETLRTATIDLNARVVEKDGVSVIMNEAQNSNVTPEDVVVHIDPFKPTRAVYAGC